jgi:hypothetical protein
MTDKHTPGPWLDYEGEVYAGKYLVADVWEHPSGDDVARANARLIAAAPDMLDALRAIRFEIECLSNHWVGPFKMAVDRVDAAIAKAEGRE